MDHESASEKADRLEKELNDILVSGKDNSEVYGHTCLNLTLKYVFCKSECFFGDTL